MELSMRRSAGPSDRQKVVPVLAIIAFGVSTVLSIFVFHRTAIRPGSLLALVDLHPKPAEHSLKPVHFNLHKKSIEASAKSFSVCVTAAKNVDEGVYCLSQLLSLVPRPLAQRSLEVAEEIHSTKKVIDDPKKLAIHLESCLSAAKEHDGAIFCVADLLSHVPAEARAKAMELGEEHPAFDWKFLKEAALVDTEEFDECAEKAEDVEAGVDCLSKYLSQMPEALVERSVYVALDLPLPTSPAEEPKELSKQLVECMKVAEGRDAAQYCLSDFFTHIPMEQLHKAYTESKEDRGKGDPFLTEFEEDEARRIGSEKPSAGLGLGVKKDFMKPNRGRWPGEDGEKLHMKA